MTKAKHKAELSDTIYNLLIKNGPMSAADVTKELRSTGDLPESWSVIDVADYMRDWFGNVS